MIHRYYAPVQLLALSPILYLTVQKGTPSSAGPLKVRGPIWSNRPKTGPEYELFKSSTSWRFFFITMISSNLDGQVRRAIASEVVDLGMIPSPVNQRLKN